MIAHLDLDAFFAAAEMHRRPELMGRPVVVGGDPDGRGVVATASYAARRFGVRSAMSAAEARRRCPGAVFVRPDIAAYREWSARVWDLVGGLVPRAEQVGLDEGYLLLPSGDPGEAAGAVQAAVRRDLRLSCSLGVATAKVVAKIASDRDKPGGVTVVPAGHEARFLAPLPVRALPGAGPRTEERLRAAGVLTIGDLAALAEGDLAAVVPGEHGRELGRRARGIDARTVSSTPAARISISTERTFPRDVAGPAEMRGLVREMAARVAATLAARCQAARTVSVKLRYPDFRTLARAHTLSAATDDGAEIAAVAWTLLTRALEDREGPVRLLGVGVSGLTTERQLPLPIAGV